jgi:hypothetical protein
MDKSEVTARQYPSVMQRNFGGQTATKSFPTLKKSFVAFIQSLVEIYCSSLWLFGG